MGFVAPAAGQVDDVEHPVRLLQQSERLIEGVSVDELDGAAVQFNQDEGNLFLGHLQLPIVMLVELFAPNHGLI